MKKPDPTAPFMILSKAPTPKMTGGVPSPELLDVSSAISFLDGTGPAGELTDTAPVDGNPPGPSKS